MPHSYSTCVMGGVEFRCSGSAAGEPLTVGILAMVAEAEAEAISSRTKAALAAATRRGVKLGNTKNFTERGRANGRDASAQVRAERADERAADRADAAPARAARRPRRRSLASTCERNSAPHVRFLLQKFGIEPLERFHQARSKGLVIVAAAGDDLELVLDPCPGQCTIHGLGLLQRNDVRCDASTLRIEQRVGANGAGAMDRYVKVTAWVAAMTRRNPSRCHPGLARSNRLSFDARGRG